MNKKLNQEIKVMAIDLAKNVFQLHGVNQEGYAIVKRKISRSKFLSYISELEPCSIVMEACAGAHDWARRFQEFGHIVKARLYYELQTKEDFKDLPEEFKISITYDNGKEFSWHKRIEEETRMTVYFAHPYSSWERGTNENTNGLLRQYMPKKTDLSEVSEKDLQHYVDLINNRPRKRLEYATPNEVLQKELTKLLKTQSL